jgi:hypothetical protein
VGDDCQVITGQGLPVPGGERWWYPLPDGVMSAADEGSLKRYALVRAVVASRTEAHGVVYLEVNLPGGTPGLITYDFVAGGEFPPRDELPEVGSELEAVVVHPDVKGRLLLTTAPSLLRLVKETGNVPRAMAAWGALHESGCTPEALRAFRASPDRLPIMRWALCRENNPRWALDVLKASPAEDVLEVVPELLVLQRLRPYASKANDLLRAAGADHGSG